MTKPATGGGNDWKDKAIRLNYTLKQKYKDQIEVKCISDEIWLYCRYLIDDADILQTLSMRNMTEEKKQKLYNRVENIYKEYVRGETYYIGKRPSMMAAGVFYVACYLEDVYITQYSIAEKLGIATVAVMKGYKLIKKQYNKRNGVHHYNRR